MLQILKKKKPITVKSDGVQLPNGSKITFTKTSRGLIDSVTDFNGSTFTYAYDEVNLLTNFVHNSGYQEKYAYDCFNRLTNIQFGKNNLRSRCTNLFKTVQV